MRLHKFLSGLFICILCIIGICNMSFADNNIPFGDIGEYGNWLTIDNLTQFNSTIQTDATKFQEEFQQNIQSDTFIPIETKIGLMFMKALYSINDVLQSSLVRFTIIFLLLMYVFWVGLTAYKTIREGTEYKTVLYDIFLKGFKVSVWILILNYGFINLFTAVVTPIIDLGTYLSDFILNTVAKTYNINMPNTCAAIHNYVNSEGTKQMMINADTAANIMCLPGRISMYFYHAIGAGFDWIKYGFGNSLTAIIVGIVSVFIFIKCIFKYAFMTLGVVADLFLTLLMLPFTALAEATPTIDEKHYVGQIFTRFLSIFNTKKLSDVITIFINATIYFVSLAIIIAVCAALLTNIISVNQNSEFVVGSAMTTILSGCFVLYLADKSDSLATQIGGKIDNSFGKDLQATTKTMLDDAKNFGIKAFKAWTKGKLVK